MAIIEGCVQLRGLPDPGESVVADEDGHCVIGKTNQNLFRRMAIHVVAAITRRFPLNKRAPRGLPRGFWGGDVALKLDSEQSSAISGLRRDPCRAPGNRRLTLRWAGRTEVLANA